MPWVKFCEWYSAGHWSICQLQIGSALETTGYIRILEWKEWIIHNSTTFKFTGEYSAYVLSLIMTDWALHICQSNLAVQSVEVTVRSGIWIRHTTLLCRGNAAASAATLSKFGCTRESSAKVFSHVMTDSVLHIYQSYLAMRHPRRYRLCLSGYNTKLADS